MEDIKDMTYRITLIAMKSGCISYGSCIVGGPPTSLKMAIRVKASRLSAALLSSPRPTTTESLSHTMAIPTMDPMAWDSS